MGKFILTILSIFVFGFNFFAQQKFQISNSDKEVIISKIQLLISENYIIQTSVESINDELARNFENGNYDSIKFHSDFAEIMTTDLRSISSDKHFKVYFDPTTPYDEKENLKNRLRYERFTNYGFSKLEILEGNIGYLKLDYFSQPNKKILKKVFAYFENVNGIIIDLRENYGGSNKMTQLLLSYFSKKKTEICSMEFADGKSKKLMTVGTLTGSRFSELPLVVLVSQKSFSAAEGFSYFLKHQKRAVLVGDTTVGGAHSVKGHKINDSLSISIPFINIINPDTKSNWEGTGVMPHIKCKYNESVLLGQKIVLEKLAENAKNQETKEYYLGLVAKLMKNGS